MSMFLAYKILGGHPGMTQDELKSLYRQKAQKFHPDRRGGDTTEFLALQGVWRLVGDAEARRILGIRLAGLGARCEICVGKGYTMKQGRGFGSAKKTACAHCNSCGYTQREPLR